MQTNEFAFSQTISELDELHEIVKGSDLVHTQLTPGSFHAKTTRINLDASFLDIGEYSRGIRAQGGIDSEGKTFFFSLHQEANANGFFTNQILITGPGGLISRGPFQCIHPLHP
jgi:hypothetical protein